MSAGERLATLAGPTAVLGIQPQHTASQHKPQTVYNLEVQGQHVFRVTSNGLLVHNMCAPRGGTYKLKDVIDGNVKRTGRSKDLDARRRAHANHPETKDLDFEVDRRTDVYAEQRGREQIIHDAHPEAWFENGGLNRIRGISLKNPRLEEYLEAGRRLSDR